MLTVNRIALLSAPVLVGSLFYSSRYFHAAAAVRSNRTYTSIRNEWEFNQLLPLPNPLLAHFCLLTDSKSKMVSRVLEDVVKSNNTPVPVSSVDVEVDEPGNSDLTLRYLVSHVPMIVLLQGGQRTGELVPKGESADEIRNEILKFIETIK